MAKMKRNRKRIIGPEGPGFPAGNMYDAAPILEELYGNDGHILLLVNSGSGKTETPLSMVKELAKYIGEKESKFKIDLVTSMPDSPIGRIAKEYGRVIKIEGRTKEEAERTSDFGKTGIMADKFELASGLLFSGITEALYYNYDISRLYEAMETELELLGRYVGRTIKSEDYKRAIDILESRSDVWGGGRGTSSFVISTLLIRLTHVKAPLGDRVYIAGGVNTLRPRAGDLGMFVSYSGETEQVIKWVKNMKRMDACVMCVTSREDSTLGKVSDMKIVIPEERKIGEPRRFYMRSVVVMSPQPVMLCSRLKERGLPIKEEVLRWYHSITE